MKLYIKIKVTIWFISWSNIHVESWGNWELPVVLFSNRNRSSVKSTFSHSYDAHVRSFSMHIIGFCNQYSNYVMFLWCKTKIYFRKTSWKYFDENKIFTFFVFKGNNANNNIQWKQPATIMIHCHFIYDCNSMKSSYFSTHNCHHFQ